MPIKVESTVEQIVFHPRSPDWIQASVETVVSKFGYSIPVSRSGVDRQPIFLSDCEWRYYEGSRNAKPVGGSDDDVAEHLLNQLSPAIRHRNSLALMLEI